jgi:hypothetical protein
MSKSGRLWRSALVGLVAAAVLFAAVDSAKAGEAVPLGRVCFRNAQGFVGKLKNLVEKFAPGMGAMVEMSAKQMMEGPMLPGVDWTKPLSLALFSGKAFGKSRN